MIERWFALRAHGTNFLAGGIFLALSLVGLGNGSGCAALLVLRYALDM